MRNGWLVSGKTERTALRIAKMDCLLSATGSARTIRLQTFRLSPASLAVEPRAPFAILPGGPPCHERMPPSAGAVRASLESRRTSMLPMNSRPPIAKPMATLPNDEPIGIPQFKEFARSVRAAFPDIKMYVEETISEGDRAVIRWRSEMTPHRGFHGCPAHREENHGSRHQHRCALQRRQMAFVEALGQLGSALDCSRKSAPCQW